jgi:hypothetical protein
VLGMPTGKAAEPIHGFRRVVVEWADRIMLDSQDGGFTLLRRLDFWAGTV